MKLILLLWSLWYWHMCTFWFVWNMKSDNFHHFAAHSVWNFDYFREILHPMFDVWALFWLNFAMRSNKNSIQLWILAVLMFTNRCIVMIFWIPRKNAIKKGPTYQSFYRIMRNVSDAWKKKPFKINKHMDWISADTRIHALMLFNWKGKHVFYAFLLFFNDCNHRFLFCAQIEI